jgi:hypothetical protein
MLNKLFIFLIDDVRLQKKLVYANLLKVTHAYSSGCGRICTEQGEEIVKCWERVALCV